jgi:hypothetical protein
LESKGIGTVIVIVIVVVIAVMCIIVGYYLGTHGGIGLGTSSLQDINEHPERYLGKEVTVEGYAWAYSTPYGEYNYEGLIYQKTRYTGLHLTTFCYLSFLIIWEPK